MSQLDPSECFTPAEAARLFPGRPAIQTVTRWILSGIIGPDGQRLKLASFKSGGRRYTTREAVAEFIAASNGEPVKPTVDDSARRSREAGRALQDLGC